MKPQLNILLIFLYIRALICFGSCPDQWQEFSRKSGGWCMMASFKAYINYFTAEEECLKLNASVSSFESQEEIDYVVESMSTLEKGYYAWIFVGGIRRENCNFDTGRVVPSCYPVSQSYQWTDNKTQGTDVLQFRNGCPDNGYGHENCLVLWTRTFTGLLDDFPCARPDINGYVCGKEAET